MPPNPLVGTYRTSDRRILMLNMLQGDRYWEPFCRAMGREELIADERYATFELRAQHRDELAEIIRDTLAAQPLSHWVAQLTKQECVFSAVQTPAEAADDPQVIANGYLAAHPTHERGRVVASPVQYNNGTISIERGAPELGQHTEEILQELGLSWDDIVRMKQEGTVT
jgi:crotonobetainyl-CoA:carnitine CoA-transferase CaiB-like acyl-CoA transferase